MIDYERRGSLPAKHHIQHRRPDGGVYYEECFTRGGFEGAYSILYHAHATTDDQQLVVSTHGWPAPTETTPVDPVLRRRLFQLLNLPSGSTMLDARMPVLFNADLVVLFARPTRSDELYFSNGDGDELAFVYEGSGRVESAFGWLGFTAGDYVWIPKGVIHRWHLDAPENKLMFLESRIELRIPKQFRNPSGQLRMDAPYCHRDFVKPQGFAWGPDTSATGPFTVVYKRGDRFSERSLPHHPLDVVGWDGYVYPVAFAIEKYQAKTGLVHLPPTIHTTFAADRFVVCSFVPRVTDTHPEAIPCPYPHTSVDCDEVIFYVRGNFTSRKCVGAGSLSLHPAGVPHGPHPGAYENSIGHHRTDELAVMIDTLSPLATTPQALSIESAGYHASWASVQGRA